MNTQESFTRMVKTIKAERGSYASRLTPFKHELIKLRQAGATYADLVFWLQKHHQIKVVQSTISKFLNKQTTHPLDSA